MLAGRCGRHLPFMVYALCSAVSRPLSARVHGLGLDDYQQAPTCLLTEKVLTCGRFSGNGWFRCPVQGWLTWRKLRDDLLARRARNGPLIIADSSRGPNSDRQHLVRQFTEGKLATCSDVSDKIRG